MENLDAVVQGKIDNDTEFQTSLTDLSDEDKVVAINEKRSVLIKSEFESLDKIAKENDKKFNDQKIRAEKAEEEYKKIKGTPVPKVEVDSVISPKDYLALTEAKVTSEDYDEVVRVSKILGKPINEALKDKTLISILETRNEERETALNTQSRGGARGSAKVTGEDLIAQASQGKLPETDEDWDKLAKARIEAKRTKK